MTTLFYVACAIAVVYPVVVIVAIARLVARAYTVPAAIAVALALAATWIAFAPVAYALSLPALLIAREAERGLADQAPSLPVLPRAKVV